MVTAEAKQSVSLSPTATVKKNELKMSSTQQQQQQQQPQGQTKPEDLMKHYGLGDVLNELRGRKLRSSFMNYIQELPNDKVPLKPKCPGGLILPIANQPVNEDERLLEEFDERVLRAALTFKESNGVAIKLPEWLDEEQTFDADESKKKKKKEKKKKKKKKKRRRNGGDDDDSNRLDEEERRLKKKRK